MSKERIYTGLVYCRECRTHDFGCCLASFNQRKDSSIYRPSWKGHTSLCIKSAEEINANNNCKHFDPDWVAIDNAAKRERKGKNWNEV